MIYGNDDGFLIFIILRYLADRYKSVKLLIRISVEDLIDGKFLDNGLLLGLASRVDVGPKVELLLEH